ncbi:hypothetical protein BU26DRAFT_335829 [Trematosphaeria pertusa]|uniref:Uncharacterized protein n=1 Tax=Trematosphaeria pertusa TaxID=390896 RepID=A0A6A6IDG8_9PLEO|nr:uncharacterized protein BU26DRAFT_335829 [Trematosphaeria pertusa]KAF2248476.1 hypothetical protein BU26DRAFT_335829 [Trematosphaeria pertusa]
MARVSTNGYLQNRSRNPTSPHFRKACSTSRNDAQPRIGFTNADPVLLPDPGRPSSNIPKVLINTPSKCPASIDHSTSSDAESIQFSVHRFYREASRVMSTVGDVAADLVDIRQQFWVVHAVPPSTAESTRTGDKAALIILPTSRRGIGSWVQWRGRAGHLHNTTDQLVSQSDPTRPSRTLEESAKAEEGVDKALNTNFDILTHRPR